MKEARRAVRGVLVCCVPERHEHGYRDIVRGTHGISSQRRGGLATVVQAHHTLEPLQVSTGDFVRTSKLLGKDKRQVAFRVKSARGVCSRGVYTVTDRARSYDSVYHLEDWRGQRVKGRFYKTQLQKVKGLPNRWRVAKKLKYKGRGPKRQVLVHWQGVAPDYQTWIPAREEV